MFASPAEADVYSEAARNRLIRDYKEIAATASGIHRAGVSTLISTQDFFEIHFKSGVSDGLRQDFLPTDHTVVH